MLTLPPHSIMVIFKIILIYSLNMILIIMPLFVPINNNHFKNLHLSINKHKQTSNIKILQNLNSINDYSKVYYILLIHVVLFS